MPVASTVFRASELQWAGYYSIFSIFGASLYTLAATGDGVGQITFYVSLFFLALSMEHYLDIFRLNRRTFCLDQKRPVTERLAYDRAIYTIYFDRTASSKFLGFNGLKGFKSGVKLESHTTQRAPNEQIHNSRWAREMHPV